MKPKTIIIAEDHTILREGVRALLDEAEGYRVVGEAGDGLEAIRSVEKLAPDLIILDLSMPRMNGFTAIREIRKQSPGTKILALTIHKSEEYILEAFQLGASGYCLKDASSSELIMAVQNVLNGKTYISPSVSAKVMTGYVEEKRTLKTKTSWDLVTQREKEVLKLIGEGYKNAEIAELLSLSVKTVEKHRANLMKKLDLHTASLLTAYAIEKGLVAL